MKTEQITPFISACEATFKTLLGVLPQREGKMALMTEMFPVHELTALISLTGGVRAEVLLSMDTEVACHAVANLLELEINEINKDVMDGVAVILNIIATSASGKLAPLQSINLGLPTVMLGKEHKVYADIQAPWIFIPMKAEGIGTFDIAITTEEEQS